MKWERTSRTRGLKISYCNIILQGLTDYYEFVKTTSVHSPNFSIDDIPSMMRNLYIDRLSRPGNVNKIAGRGVAVTNHPETKTKR